MRDYCVDDSHGAPCPLPCSVCVTTCDITAQVEAENVVEAARADGLTKNYISGEVAAGRMPMTDKEFHAWIAEVGDAEVALSLLDARYHDDLPPETNCKFCGILHSAIWNG